MSSKLTEQPVGIMTQDSVPTSASNGSSIRFNSLNPPVHRASTVFFETAAAFLSRKSQLFDGFSYGLYATPTTRALEERVARIEGGQRVVLLPSGLATLTHTMLALLETGDHVLVVDCVYGPLREFCMTTLKRMGISVSFCRADADHLTPLDARTRMVVLESPGSYTMEIQEIATLCQEAHAVGALVMMDNSWGFGNSHMFELGVDIVSSALSKYASGHSDVCMGSVTVGDEELYRKLKTFASVVGSGVSSDDAYLVLRGLNTLELRLQEQSRRGVELTKWLRGRAEVRDVINPADADDSGHARFRKYFSGGNGLVSLFLRTNNLHAISAMLDGLQHFRIGASWGGTSSLVALLDLSGQRTVESWGAGSYILRLHMGLEPIELLYEDLEAGFARLAAHG